MGRKLILLIIALSFSGLLFSQTIPGSIQLHIEVGIETPDGDLIPLEGLKQVEVKLFHGNTYVDWTETHKFVDFDFGKAVLYLGDDQPFERSMLDTTSPNFRIRVEGVQTRIDIHAVPYAFHATYADNIPSIITTPISFEDTVTFNNNVSGNDPPFFVDSTTVVPLLNADLLDGEHREFYQSASNIISGVLSPSLLTGAYLNINQIGTLNSLAVAGDIVVSSSVFFVDASESRVGIGTNTPEYDLDVQGTVNASYFIGDGFNLTNLNGANLLGLVADSIEDNTISSSKIVTGAVQNYHVATPDFIEEGIPFAKLFITKRDLVEDLTIPTEDTTLNEQEVISMIAEYGFLTSGNNLSDVRSTEDARNNLGLGVLSTPTFNGVHILNLLSGLNATFNGTVSANYFSGNGAFLRNLYVTGDGTIITGVTAIDITDNAIVSSNIVDGSIFNYHIATPNFIDLEQEGIPFAKLYIVKKDIVDLGIPTADTHRSTENVLILAGDNYLTSENSLSEIHSSQDARINLGIGATAEPSFNTLIVTGSGSGPHLYGVGPLFVASINGTVSADFFAGDGSDLFNLNGAIIENVMALTVTDNSISSESIVSNAIRDHHVHADAGILFSKLNILKSDIVNIGGISGNIPTANRTTDNIISLLDGHYLASSNSLSELTNTANARLNIGLGPIDNATLNAIVLNGTGPGPHLLGMGAGTFIVSINGTLKADYFYGDGSELTDIDGTEIKNVTAEHVTDNSVFSNTIVDGEILNEDVSDNADIDFDKLFITKWDIVSLGIPSRNRTSENVIEIAQPDFLATLNNLSELTNTFNARINLGLGPDNNVTFNSLVLQGTGSGPHLFGVADGFVASFNGHVSANSFQGDGALLTNLDGSHIIGLIASSVFPDSIFSSSILDGTIMNIDITDNAGIPYSKLNILKSDIVNIGGIPGNIPAANRTTGNILDLLAGQFLSSANNLSELTNTADARTILGMNGSANPSFNSLILNGSGVGPHLVGEGIGFIVSVNGHVSANSFSGDGSLITNLDGTELNGVTAIGVIDDAIDGDSIAFDVIMNDHVNSAAGIDFSKLFVEKSDIVGLGIPTANRTTENIIALLDGHFLSSQNNLSELTDTANARANIGLGEADNVTFNGLILLGDGPGPHLFGKSVAGNFVVSINGDIHAERIFGDGTGLENIDGSEIKHVDAHNVQNNTIYSSSIVDGVIRNEDISDSAAIDFSKLAISKWDIVALGIPSTNRTTSNIVDLLADQFFATNNNLSELTSSLDARINLGLGATHNVTFNKLVIMGEGSGPHFILVTDNFGISINGTISANMFVGDGSLLTNLDGSHITGITATNVLPNSIDSLDILNNEIVNADINSAAAIEFTKLNITKANIESLDIPGSQRSTDSVISVIQNDYLSTGNNLALLSDPAAARLNIGMAESDNVSFNNVVVMGSSLLGLGSNFIASFNGDVKAFEFYGDGSGITNIDPLSIPGLKADFLEPSIVDSDSVIDLSLFNIDISAGAAIEFGKLDISKADIVGLGIPTANRTTDNIQSMFTTEFAQLSNSLSDLFDATDARDNLGLGTTDTPSFNNLILNGTLLHGTGSGFTASINGVVKAEYFHGDGSGITNATGLSNYWDKNDITQTVTYTGVGNIAIGLTEASTRLEVAGSVSANIYYGDGSGLTNLPFPWSLDGSDGLYTSKKIGIGSVSNPLYQLYVDGDVKIDGDLDVEGSLLTLESTSTTELVLGTSGSGAAAGNAMLYMYRKENSQSSGIQFKNGDDSNDWYVGVFKSNPDKFGIGYDDSDPSLISNNPPLTIDSVNKNIGIYNTNPNFKYVLDVNGKSFFEGDITVAGDIIPDSSSLDLGDAGDPWNEVFVVNLNQSSDRRLKKNIEPLLYSINTLMKLRPVSYLWKNKPGQGTQLGLIAQEVYEVVPEVVHVAEDADSKWGVNYTGLIPILIKSAQDQQKVMSEQDNSIDALMEKLEKLERDIQQVQDENDSLR
jgi:hypothetical protein